MSKAGRIDTHHHVVPPGYTAWLRSKGLTSAGMPLPEWSVDSALELMDATGVESSVLSVSMPGVHVGDDAEARRMAREVNEYAAQVARDHPRRFGFFATLTLPDVDGALREAAHALDVLGADGIILLANARGVYLGDPSIRPLMEELERRKAVVFVHPAELPAAPVPGIPPHAADFLLDTTRAAINMARCGWLDDFGSVKIILAHGGGFLPYAAQRVARMCSPDGDSEAGIEKLRRFYFDTALTSSPYGLPSLLAFADPSRISYGSDWPYAPRERSMGFTRMFDSFEMGSELRDDINHRNMKRLFPRFASAT